MKCPRCLQPIHRAADACPLCGFSIVDADRRFGPARQLGLLSDEAGVIRRPDRERVLRALHHVHHRFPQCFAALCITSIGEVRQLRPMAFWLLNRAIFSEFEQTFDNQYGILLLIDPSTKSATFSFGYGLEPYLNEEETFECLSRAHAYWLDGQYALGVTKALTHLEQILLSKTRKATAIAKRWRQQALVGSRKEEQL